MRKNNLFITSCACWGHWPRATGPSERTRGHRQMHLGWDWTHKEGKAKTVDNIGFTKRVANGPTDRGFDYFTG